jgi:serine protease Do
LLRLLTDQPMTPPPPVGPRKLLPPRERRASTLQSVDSEQIADKFGNATVYVYGRWRLYDQETGKPLFHKTFFHDGMLLPAYVNWKGGLYRWLTFQDELQTNYWVGGSRSGTGFVIDEQGLTLTNTHIAAGWLVNYFAFSHYETGRGVLFKVQDGFYGTPDEFLTNNKGQPFDFSYNGGTLQELVDWRPEQGGPIFAGSQPVLIDKDARIFEGKNEELSVRVLGNLADLNALFVLPSVDSGIALT